MSLDNDCNSVVENEPFKPEGCDSNVNETLLNGINAKEKTPETHSTSEDNDKDITNESTVKEVQMDITQPSKISYDFSSAQELASANEFSTSPKNNLLRGCKWAPDGTCVLTNSQDNALRLFNLPNEFYANNSSSQNLPPLQSVLKMQEGGLIYDFCWYPHMSSWDPATCCLLSTSAKSPVHLWDAYSSELRATYRIYDNVDEVTSAISLNFSPGGDQLYCGLKNMLAVFDTAIPGREYYSLKIKEMKGIISCIALSPVAHHVMAAGTYTKSIGLFSLDDNSLMCTLNGHRGGLTHIMFSPDGSKLYSGARKDNEILCWDLRNPGSVLFSLIRTVETNQRIYFDLTADGKYLISGSTCGVVKIWDTTQPSVEVNEENIIHPISKFQAHHDCTNGVSLNNHWCLLATASGQHHVDKDLLHVIDDDEDDSCLTQIAQSPENLLKLWRVGSNMKL